MSVLFDQLAARMVADLIRDYKLQAFQAAAFPGNAGEESGGLTKLQEQNPRSGRGGLGYFQDTGPRRVAFEEWLADPRNAGKHYSAGDYAANYSFLVRELDGPESHVLAPLRAAKTLEEATEIVMQKFERPYLPTAHLEVRIDYARKALAAFQATGQDEEALRAQGRPGSQGTQEIYPPGTVVPIQHQQTHSIPTNLLPEILDSILPVITDRITKSQPDLGKIIAEVTKLQPATPVVAPQGTPASQRPSVWLSTAAAIGAAVLQAHGDLGTPVGPNATTAGLMTNVLTVGSTIFAALGGWQGIGKTALLVLKLIPK